MHTLWPWVSRLAWVAGLGALPLRWAPIRRAPALLRAACLVWGLLQLLLPIWFDLPILATIVDVYVVTAISRVFSLFAAIWFSHRGLNDLLAQLERLDGRYPDVVPRDSREVSGCWLLLAILSFGTVDELYKKSEFIKVNGGASLGVIVFAWIDRLLNMFVPGIYIMLIEELTHLFRKVDHLWKKELNYLVSGSIDSHLQGFRIFHTEISTAISDLKRALGACLLLFFAFTFASALLAFHGYSSGRNDNFYSMSANLIVSATSILLVVRSTQRTVDASEEISSNLRDLKLSKLSDQDQIQVELLLQKLAFRPVRVDVCGMFTINKQLILEIIMGVTTCCNAIVQLKPYVIIDQTNPLTAENTSRDINWSAF